MSTEWTSPRLLLHPSPVDRLRRSLQSPSLVVTKAGVSAPVVLTSPVVVDIALVATPKTSVVAVMASNLAGALAVTLIFPTGGMMPKQR